MTQSRFFDLLNILEKSTPSERRVFLSFSESNSEQQKADIFILWWCYYYSEDFECILADFHYDWIVSMFSWKPTMIEWFRGSIKTSITLAVVTYLITNKAFSFIVWQSFESEASKRNTTQIARKLMNDKLVKDFGVIFSATGSRDELEKRSVWEFDTKNGVKVLATSLGENLRGAVSKNSRPDLLILDDIDVSKSVTNSEIIDKNFDKITWETFWSLNKKKSKIIFLGNTINSDWVVPRMANQKKWIWEIFRQPLYTDDGKIAWSFFTEKMIQEIKEKEWDKAFSQNYLLKPTVSWDLFFASQEKLVTLPYAQDTKYPDIWIYRKPEWMLCFGVDTAMGGANGDYSTISVRNIEGKLYAFYRWRVPPDALYDEIIMRLIELGYFGRIGIESNNTGIATINKAKVWLYSHFLYSTREIDTRTGKQSQKLWWNTNSKTRPLMLAELEEMYRKWAEIDKRTFEELQYFVYASDRTPSASSPHHDDCIIADAICNQMRKFPYFSNY